jgi:DNA-binding XRE family transcriptional regulator
MGELVKFPDHQARASTGSWAPISARASKVTSAIPRSEDNLTSASQYPDGMPPGRVRQPLTVGGTSESASATALVPPSESMTKSGVIMPANIVCTVQTCQVFATRKTTFSKKCGAIEVMMDPPHVIAARLKALRIELGFKTQVAFAEKLGIDKSTYNLYEKAKRPLTFETACLIRRGWGISIDWLFFGDLQQSAIQTMAKIGRGTEAPQPKVKRIGAK